MSEKNNEYEGDKIRISEIEDLTGKRILPPLPEEYDRDFIVDAGTIDEESQKLLADSGYRIVHRPYFSMEGSTHKKWELNPHRKSVVDAAPADAEAIPFSEFEALFDESEI
jgi:hypothetical protein